MENTFDYRAFYQAFESAGLWISDTEKSMKMSSGVL